MTYNEESTELIHTVMYGSWQPESVWQRYMIKETGLRSLIRQKVSTMPEYLCLRNQIIPTAFSANEWEHPEECTAFFYPAYSLPATFHPLAGFFRMVLHRECRLILAHTSLWLEELELTLLSHELIQLTHRISGYLKEAGIRHRSFQKTNDPSNSERLSHFIWQECYLQLLCLAKELQLRYAHHLEDRAMDEEELYMMELEREVPELPEVLLSVQGLRFMLGQIPEAEQRMPILTNLLTTHYPAMAKLVHEGDAALQHSLQSMLEVAEEEWLGTCLLLQNTKHLPEHTTPVQVVDVVQKALEKGVKADVWLPALERAVGTLREAFLTEPFGSYTNGRAGRYMKGIEAQVHQQVSPVSQVPGSVQLQKQPPTILDQYILQEELISKLKVNKVTFNKYLAASGIKVVKMSTKTVLIHQQEVEKFLAYYEQTATEE